MGERSKPRSGDFILPPLTSPPGWPPAARLYTLTSLLPTSLLPTYRPLMSAIREADSSSLSQSGVPENPIITCARQRPPIITPITTNHHGRARVRMRVRAARVTFASAFVTDDDSASGPNAPSFRPSGAAGATVSASPCAAHCAESPARGAPSCAPASTGIGLVSSPRAISSVSSSLHFRAIFQWGTFPPRP